MDGLRRSADDDMSNSSTCYDKQQLQDLKMLLIWPFWPALARPSGQRWGDAARLARGQLFPVDGQRCAAD